MLSERSGIESLLRDKSAVLAQWAQMIAGSASVQPLPLRLCLACVRLADADGGAITLAYTRTERVTLCVTDETAARLEDLQDVLGQGPGPDAYRTGQTVTASLGESAAGRWPMFTQAAQAAVGQAALYSFPIRPDGEVLGVLTLYQAAPRPLRYELAELQFLAGALGVALLRDPGSRTDAGIGPWSSRAQVHQATGMVVAQLGIGPDDALALLRAHAYAHTTSLEVIAGQVLSRHLDFTTTDTGTDRNGNETP
jgi:ANTAR domain/GAF domain